MHELITTNPEHITWKYDELHFAVLGGIRLDGLDRMRITVKIEFRGTVIRHNLDVYNDSQSEKLIKKCAERFEMGVLYIAKAVGELISVLENYRLDEIKRKKEKEQPKKVLTDAEREAAENFLKEKNLIARTQELIGKSGVVGEEANRLLLFLVFTSRKMQRPLHAISFGSSGTGKSHLQETVGQLIPEEEKIEITSLTENAFYYFGQQELRHKLILIEDLDGAENVLYPLRELQSKRSITKTVTVKTNTGQTKTETLRVEGPVSVSGCTTRESVYEDNANRSFLLYLDESKEQDERVMQYQRAQSAGMINAQAEYEAKTLLKNAQRILQSVTVKNPYAQLLKLPEGVFKPRRTNAHYLQFIEAVTFYHQKQREEKHDEQSGEIYIETTPEDIATANELMKDVLLRKSDELSGACRQFFEGLKAHLKQNNIKQFTNKEIRAAMRINHNTQKMFMVSLQQYGYIKKTEGDKKKGFYYEISSYEEYTQLETRIASVLDQMLETISSPSGRSGGADEEVKKLEEVVKPVQPLKPAPAKRKKAEVVKNEEMIYTPQNGEQ
jgi:hypothetical protein